MLRRNFIKAGIASVFGCGLAKASKSKESVPKEFVSMPPSNKYKNHTYHRYFYISTVDEAGMVNFLQKNKGSIVTVLQNEMHKGYRL